MRRIFIALLFLFFICTFLSCSKSNMGANNHLPLDCSGPSKSFATDVSPVIQGTCNSAGCHTNGSTNGPGPITNYNQVFNARNAIRSAIESGLMPQNSSLSSTQRNAIICWIDSGAPNN